MGVKCIKSSLNQSVMTWFIPSIRTVLHEVKQELQRAREPGSSGYTTMWLSSLPPYIECRWLKWGRHSHLTLFSDSLTCIISTNQNIKITPKLLRLLQNIWLSVFLSSNQNVYFKIYQFMLILFFVSILRINFWLCPINWLNYINFIVFSNKLNCPKMSLFPEFFCKVFFLERVRILFKRTLSVNA
jgi:hypothetical protein